MKRSRHLMRWPYVFFWQNEAVITAADLEKTEFRNQIALGYE